MGLGESYRLSPTPIGNFCYFPICYLHTLPKRMVRIWPPYIVGVRCGVGYFRCAGSGTSGVTGLGRVLQVCRVGYFRCDGVG